MVTILNDDQGWKRDETPYLIFCCSKCKQFRYVKTTQKTCKCLRCGRVHYIENFLASGEIVKGMTPALERVQELQNNFGGTPDLKTEGGFTVAGNITTRIPEQKSKKILDPDEEIDYTANFLSLIKELNKEYENIPDYMFEMMADNFGIPKRELVVLKRKFISKGYLIILKNKYYKIKIKKSSPS